MTIFHYSRCYILKSLLCYLLKNEMYNFCPYFFCSFLPMHFWEEDGVGEFALLTNNDAPGVRNLHFFDPG